MPHPARRRPWPPARRPNRPAKAGRRAERDDGADRDARRGDTTRRRSPGRRRRRGRRRSRARSAAEIRPRCPRPSATSGEDQPRRRRCGRRRPSAGIERAGRAPGRCRSCRKNRRREDLDPCHAQIVPQFHSFVKRDAPTVERNGSGYGSARQDRRPACSNASASSSSRRRRSAPPSPAARTKRLPTITPSASSADRARLLGRRDPEADSDRQRGGRAHALDGVRQPRRQLRRARRSCRSARRCRRSRARRRRSPRAAPAGVVGAASGTSASPLGVARGAQPPGLVVGQVGDDQPGRARRRGALRELLRARRRGPCWRRP